MKVGESTIYQFWTPKVLQVLITLYKLKDGDWKIEKKNNPQSDETPAYFFLVKPVKGFTINTFHKTGSFCRQIYFKVIPLKLWGVSVYYIGCQNEIKFDSTPHKRVSYWCFLYIVYFGFHVNQPCIGECCRCVRKLYEVKRRLSRERHLQQHHSLTAWNM